MKRPIALLASLLAVTVLVTAATAAGGDSSDPLISLNYLQTTFTTKANSSIDAALDKSDQAAYAKAEAALRSTIAAAEANVGAQRADVFTESRLKQGDILSGTTGLQVIVLAGSVNVQFSSGAVVDVTTGSEVKKRRGARGKSPLSRRRGHDSAFHRHRQDRGRELLRLLFHRKLFLGRLSGHGCLAQNAHALPRVGHGLRRGL